MGHSAPLGAALSAVAIGQGPVEEFLYRQCMFHTNISSFHSKVAYFVSRLPRLQRAIRESKGYGYKADSRRAACQAQLVQLHAQINGFARELLAFETATADVMLVTAQQSRTLATDEYAITIARFDARVAAIELKLANLQLAITEL